MTIRTHSRLAQSAMALTLGDKLTTGIKKCILFLPSFYPSLPLERRIKFLFEAREAINLLEYGFIHNKFTVSGHKRMGEAYLSSTRWLIVQLELLLKFNEPIVVMLCSSHFTTLTLLENSGRPGHPRMLPQVFS